uniref:carbohydrate ABC transporter permease n=1 Tax=Candidatus Planktophila sp. TaxID=2175601 RepID=UPI0040498741
MKKKLLSRLGIYSSLIVLLIFVIFPIYYMLTVSLRTQNSMFSNPSWFPVDMELKNYRVAFTSRPFLTAMRNSLVIGIVTTSVGLVFSVLAAYSLTILRYRGRDTFGRIIIVAFLTPGALLFIPLAVIAARLNISNTLHGLMIIYLSFIVPLGTYLLLGFFRNLVGELEEAARIDGASRLQALWFILLPLIAPGIAAVGILTFTACWNEYLVALVLNPNPEFRTLPVAVTFLQVADESPIGLIMAYSSIGAIPILILFFIGQRFIVEGLQTGAVKG